MKKLYCLITIIFIFYGLHAQVYTNSYPQSKVGTKGLFGKQDKIKTHILPELDTAEFKNQMKQNNIDKPFEFAKVRPVNLSISSGDWEMISSDTSVWRLKIISKHALSLSVNFDQFHLTNNAEMYIYNEEGTMITGPITSKENNPENVWGSSIYKGEGVILEIKVPSKSKDSIVLHINSIAHGYKKIFVEKTFGESGTCNINVLCPLGTGWDNERNSVALVLNASGSEHCSGALINNTCNNLRPYFLTANHCYTAANAGAVSNWRFIFQYWSPTCNPTQDGSRSVLFNGSVLRANSATSDFTLLELNQTPSVNSGITYSGWSRTGTAPAMTTGIHHPSGDVMKISRDNNPPIKTNAPGFQGANHWQVTWDQGVTEGGSSGSPLYDDNHRIIGQLHGGYSSCSSTDLRDWYGAFDVSWTGGGTDATRLSNWLDPNITGAATLDAINSNSYSISGANQFCSEQTYSITGLPAGATVIWTIDDPSGAVSRQDIGNTVKLTKITDGTITLTATITLCGYNVQRSMSIIVGDFNGYFVKDGTAYTLLNEIQGSNYLTPSWWTVIHATSSTNAIPQWTPIGGYNYSWTIAGNELELNIQSGGIAEFDMSIATACGTKEGVYIFESDGGYGYYSMSPNPATSDVTVYVDEEKIKNLKTEKLEDQVIQKIIIMDKQGNAVVQQSFASNTKKATINISTLNPDIYFIRIFNGKKWTILKLVKK